MDVEGKLLSRISDHCCRHRDGSIQCPHIVTDQACSAASAVMFSWVRQVYLIDLFIVLMHFHFVIHLSLSICLALLGAQLSDILLTKLGLTSF